MSIAKHKTRAYLRAKVLLTVCALLTSAILYAQRTASGYLKQALAFSDTFQPPEGNIDSLYRVPDVRAFYVTHDFDLVWQDGVDIQHLLTALEGSLQHGLDPAYYHQRELQALLRLPRRSNVESAVLDLLLTDAFCAYAHDLLFGRLNPESIYPGQWEAARHTAEVDVAVSLDYALINHNIDEILEQMQPALPAYAELRQQLQLILQQREHVVRPNVADGPVLSIGMTDARIPAIRERFALPKDSCCVYDSTLWRQIILFQRSRGLQSDGIIGAETMKWLNRPVNEDIRSIRVNLERMRWLPRDRPEAYVQVNIPAFMLTVTEGDSVIMRMKAIVGRPERKTPVFESEIKFMVFNPTWTVPPTILREDVLPAVSRDVDYLSQHRLRVIDRKGNEIDPLTVEWSEYSARRFPYAIRQDPGPLNSLGLVKFHLPNHYSVFLHDTNAPGLFSSSNRAQSSGCIRIEQPFQLADYLLRQTRWTPHKLERILSSGKTTTVELDDPMPIYIVYLTAFVEEGVLQLRDDIYGLDEALLNGLQ